MNKSAIICVDDDPTILIALKAQLKTEYKNRFLFEFAESGDEGLEILDEFSDDGINTAIILSDWLMPDMRGDEFLIKVHKKYPQIVKILLTGQADSDAIKNAEKHADLFSYLKKPWDKTELFNTIESGLKQITS